MICKSTNTGASILVKRCTKCGEIRPIREFGENGRGGITASCKPCRKLWRAANAEKIYQYNRQYNIDRAEIVRAKRRAYKHKNPEKRLYNKNYPEKSRYYCLTRRATKQCATPAWLTKKQLRQMLTVCLDAWWITRLTGVPHQVDHVHPLKGDNFCGLHVPWNLQLLTKPQNSGKCNRPPPEEANLFWSSEVVRETKKLLDEFMRLELDLTRSA